MNILSEKCFYYAYTHPLPLPLQAKEGGDILLSPLFAEQKGWECHEIICIDI